MCTMSGALELLEYVTPLVTEEDIKQFEKKREQDFETQVIHVCRHVM